MILIILIALFLFLPAQGDPPWNVTLGIDNVDTSDPIQGSFDITYDNTTDIAHIHFLITGIAIASAVNNEGIAVTFNPTNGYMAWDPFESLPGPASGVLATVFFNYDENWENEQVVTACFDDPLAYFSDPRDIPEVWVGWPDDACPEIWNPYDCSGCFIPGSFPEDISDTCDDWYFEHCMDCDGDGLGTPGTAEYFCENNAPEPYVPNCTDPSHFPYVNITYGNPECFGDIGQIPIYYECDEQVTGFNFSMSDIFLTNGMSPIQDFFVGVSNFGSNADIDGHSFGMGLTYPTTSGSPELLCTLTFDWDLTMGDALTNESCFYDVGFAQAPPCGQYLETSIPCNIENECITWDVCCATPDTSPPGYTFLAMVTVISLAI